MSQQLQGKVGVLYVLENDAKSHRALSIAQFLPEIYIQYVGLLSEDKIPPWLKEVPTCVTLEDRKLHTGTEALELLASLQRRKQQQQPKYPPQQQPYPSQQQYPPQQQPYPSQQQYPPQQQPYPSQQQQQPYPPQQQPYPPQQQPFIHPSMRPASRRPDGFSGAPPSQSQPNSNADEVVKGSLRPASGTGQYGCSLDLAFSPPEEIQTDQPRTAGKVDQQDIESYLRLREQTGKLKTTHAMIQQ